MGSGESLEQIRLEQRPEGPGNESSVAAMASPYPKHRDLLIKGFVILFLVVLAGGGYLFFKGAGSALDGLRNNPVEFVSRLIWGEGVFDTCQAFVRENEKLFEHLGKDVKLSVIRQEVSVVNRAKTAKIVARAQGETEKETVFFFLERQKGKWRVATVASRTGKGEYKALYPQGNALQDKI